MNKPFGIVTLLLVTISLSDIALSDYYLKFEATGATHPSNQSLGADTNAYLFVSIVDTYPTDGPIHFENSNIGSRVYVQTVNYHNKDTTLSNRWFYVADVPRSVELMNLATGGRETISFGDSPKQLNNAPALLLPDGLVVASGFEDNNYVQKNFVVAAMPAHMTAAPHQPVSFQSARDPTNTNSYYVATHFCVDGWNDSVLNKNAIEIWQTVPHKTAGNACLGFQSFSGPLTHRISFR